MKVYLIRHGIAAEKDTYADDQKRPLTDKGCQKTIQVAQRLLAIGVKFDLILSSPLVRAKETAEILQNQGLSSGIEYFPPLQPDGAIEQWLEWLQQDKVQNNDSSVGLVGHQPDLGNWAEKLVWGTTKGQIIVKKAGIIGLNLPPIGTPIARSTLFLLTSPKWLI